MIQLTIFDIKTKISQDEINAWKWQLLLKIHQAHNENKISQQQYEQLKKRVDIYLEYKNDNLNLINHEEE